METLYGIMMDGHLDESRASVPGRRSLDGKPGVYMFSDQLKDKCLKDSGHYARWLCLKDDGVFVRVVWQVQTDRTDAKGSGTDQWIGMTRSTKLEALWVQVHNIEQISLSDEVQMSWDDALEFRPRRAKSHHSSHLT